MEIASIEEEEQSLRVSFSDGQVASFPYLWLRDHSNSDEHWDRATSQRISTANDIFYNAVPEKICCEDGERIKVYWKDSHVPSTYLTQFLVKAMNEKDRPVTTPKRCLWQVADLESTSDFKFRHEDIFTEEQFANILKSLVEYGFVLLRDCPPDIGTIETLSKQFSYARQTIFGGIWEFSANNDRDDSAYTDLALGAHTDSTYSHDAPGLQMLLCCEYEAIGGASTMVDGFKIAQEIKRTQPDLYALLEQAPISGSYVGDGVSLCSERTVLRNDRHGMLEQVSFNHYDRLPLGLGQHDLYGVYEALAYFEALAEKEQYQWKYTLKPGEMIIFDNWRVLHGREAFKGKRKLAGCYINREDFESTLRLNNPND